MFKLWKTCYKSPQVTLNCLVTSEERLLALEIWVLTAVSCVAHSFLVALWFLRTEYFELICVIVIYLAVGQNVRSL